MSDPGRPRNPRLRLFYALWPGDAQRAALVAATAPAVTELQGKRVPPGNLHVTLAFLGMVPETALVSLVEVGGQGPWPAVEITFDRLEYWAKPGIVVAMPASEPAAGRQIVDRLWQSLEPLGFEREPRSWQPHLTVMRRVRKPPPENLVLAPVNSAGVAPLWRLALVESSSCPDGPRYKPLADWPLEP